MDGEFLSILGTMVILFFDISIGYIAKKAHVMDKTIDKGLSKLILNTALPAMILGRCSPPIRFPNRPRFSSPWGCRS